METHARGARLADGGRGESPPSDRHSRLATSVPERPLQARRSRSWFRISDVSRVNCLSLMRRFAARVYLECVNETRLLRKERATNAHASGKSSKSLRVFFSSETLLIFELHFIRTSTCICLNVEYREWYLAALRCHVSFRHGLCLSRRSAGLPFRVLNE